MIAFMLKTLRRLLAVGALVVLSAAAVGYFVASRSLPDYAESRVVEGVSAPVEIIRDAYAAPHVFAESERDAFFGLGYAHAQDRLWQMELRRRVVQGRLTEAFGGWLRAAGGIAISSDAAETQEAALIRLDAAMRALDLQGAAEASLSSLSDETRALIEAYAAGVNAWLARVDDGALGGGAPELFALGLGVEPWRAVDSVAAMKLIAAQLSPSFVDETTRAALAIAVDPERLADLYPGDAGAVGLGAAGDASDGAFEDWAAAFGAPFSGRLAAAGAASNAWAVAGARSASRAPLLANDPHLPLSAPTLWYVAHLDMPDAQAIAELEALAAARPASADEGPSSESVVEEPRRAVIGATIPGVPAVLIGRNDDLAWGMTALHADVADLALEEIDPEDPERYRTATGWARFETREAVIPVGGGEAVSVTLRRSAHGPLLPLDWGAAARVTPPGHALALQWTALAEDDTSIEAAIDLMRARSVNEGLDASEKAVAPPTVLMLADRARIAMTATGRLPLRRAESETRGALPARGWRSENDWIGALPAADLPRVVDPADGWLANANNRIGAKPFPEDLAQHWPPDYRQKRILELLGARAFHTAAGFETMQADRLSILARSLTPLIGESLFAKLESETGLRREALDRLKDWDGDMDAVAAEPLIFTEWLRALTVELAQDELGPGLALQAARPRFVERVFRDEEGAAARWCDVVGTPGVEPCGEIASRALDRALERLSEAHGSSINRWRWGVAHAARHAHEPFGRVPLLSTLFDIRHEMAGGPQTVARAASAGSVSEGASDETVLAGGLRTVFDLADLDRSVFAIATGQSGHFLSRHYDDFVETWRSGGYRLLSTARRDFEPGSVGRTVLSPAQASP